MPTSKSQIDSSIFPVPPVASVNLRITLLSFAVFSLWATITNAVPLSIAFVVVAPIAVLSTPRNETVPRVVVFLLGVYFYFLLSTVTYAPSSVLEPEFYRRDGNFFVTFLPLLVFSLVAMPVDLERVVKYFVVWAGVANLILLTIYFFTGGTMLFREEGVYHFLFEAHNAAGGYLSVITALTFAVWRNAATKPIWIILLLGDLVGLYLTESRGSELALLLSWWLVVCLKERHIKKVVIAVVVVTVAVLLYTYPIWVSSGKPGGVADVSVGDGITGRDANVLDRVLYLWPRAVDLFFQSPLVGTGFGSYNDLPYRLEGQAHILEFNDPVVLTFSSAHAHNSYLHILAETGLIGLTLVVLLLSAILREIRQVKVESVQLGLTLAFWVAIFSSMTEHRLFTPAQMLPFTILSGLAISDRRWRASDEIRHQ